MTVSIKNLRLQVILGVNPAERTTERDIVINLRLDYDAARAASTDALDDAIDYKEVRDGIIAATKGTSFHLIESLAAHIIEALGSDPRIDQLHLEIDKPGALRLAESVSVATSWRR